MGCAADAEIVVRLWDIQFLEEDIRHVGVKVLAGVDDYFCEVVMFGNGAGDWSSFDKLRSGADYCYNFHFLVHRRDAEFAENFTA